MLLPSVARMVAAGGTAHGGRTTDGRRRRGVRRLGVVVLAVVLLVVAATAAARWDLVVATVTHRIGEPTQTWDVVALPEEAQPWLRVALVGTWATAATGCTRRQPAIEAQSQVDHYDTLMLLGDNVYPAGDPERIQATVFEPFGPLLDSGTDLFAVLGNHDVMEDTGDAQLTPWACQAAGTR